VRIGRYLLGRSVRGVVTLLIMIAVVFALYFAIETQPPVQNYVYGGLETKQPAVQDHAVRHLFYLDDSKPRLFLDYVWGLVHGDLGHARSIDETGNVVDGGSVGSYVDAPLGATLSLLLGGAMLVLLLSLPLGAISGSRIGSWADRLISFFALLMLCAHPMMLALVVRSIGGSTHWIPTTGYCSLTGHSIVATQIGGAQTYTCGGVADWASHLAVPWLTFALLFLALYTRMVRASVAETINKDFVRTARAKGASNPRVIGFHVLPSAGLRVLTMVGMEVGTAIATSIYIESAYGINGLGQTAIQNLGGEAAALNLPDCLAIVVLITLIVIVGNLVVDLLYATLDPRVGIGRTPARTKSVVGGVF
jgi:peptide/nickel transport system permease protein